MEFSSQLMIVLVHVASFTVYCAFASLLLHGQKYFLHCEVVECNIINEKAGHSLIILFNYN